MTLYFAELTSPEVAEAAARNTVILLPVGQVEEHGPHLPLNCDCIIAEELARAAAEAVAPNMPVLVMPTVWSAYSVQQVARWPGLITFREPESMIQMMYDILASLAENGFKKLVMVNGHGNNPAILELASRRIGSDYDVFPAVINTWHLSKAIGPKVRRSAMGGCGGHADEYETALLLHLTPHLVHMDRATDVDLVQYRTRFYPGDMYSDIPNKVGGIFWSTWGVAPSDSGAYGDPTAATAETGKALFEAIVAEMAAFLGEFSRHSDEA
ncbi:MAG: creatininase family protein [Anaerolineae bacterium]